MFAMLSFCGAAEVGKYEAWENYAPLPLLYAKDYSMILRGHKKENEDLIYVQARIRYLTKKYDKKNYSVLYLV